MDRRAILAVLFVLLAVGSSFRAVAQSRNASGAYYSDSPCVEKLAGVDFFRKADALQPAKTFHIAVILKNPSDPYWQEISRGIRAAAEQYHADIVLKSGSGGASGKQQLAVAQRLASQNFDAYVVAPESSSNLFPALRQIKRRHLPIVNVGGARVAATTFVGPDHELEGRQAALMLASLYAQKSNIAKLFFSQNAKIAQIEGALRSDATIKRIEGFERRVGQSDHLSLVDSVPGEGNGKTAYEAADTLMKQHPDLKAIYANDDTMALGAAEAVEAAEKDIAVVGTGGSPAAIAAVRHGALAATVSALPYYQGFWAVESAIRLAQGQHIPGWIVAPAQVISKHNVHVFYDKDGKAQAGLYR